MLYPSELLCTLSATPYATELGLTLLSSAASVEKKIMLHILNYDV